MATEDPDCLNSMNNTSKSPIIVHAETGVTLAGGGRFSSRLLNESRAIAPCLVAADGGADRLLAHGAEPEAVIGDLESLSAAARDRLRGRVHQIPEQLTTDFDKALRPLHGRSHDEMNVLRKRVYLPAKDQQRCAQLDQLLPSLEADGAAAKGEAKARADVDLYKARKQFFDLKC